MDHPRNELLAHGAWVRRLAGRLLADSHLAEEVAQETLAVAIERPPDLQGETDRLRRWLGGVARNLARATVRKESRRLAGERAAARPVAEESESGSVQRLELHRKLVAAVEGLGEPYRTTLLLRFFDDLAPREIARRQGVAGATVRKRLSRGLEQLRERLDSELGGRSACCAALLGIARPARIWAEASTPITTTAVAAASAVVVIGVLASVQILAGRAPRPTLVSVQLEAGEVRSESTARSDARLQADEREAVASIAASSEPRLLVEVSDAITHAPLPGVLVLGLDTSAALHRSLTNEAGHASILAGSIESLTAFLPGRPVALGVPDPGCGLARLVLPAGQVLSGRVRIDGSEPDRELSFRLITLTSDLDPIPEAMRTALIEAGAVGQEHTVPTDVQGDFRIGGLPGAWSGRMIAPRSHAIVAIEGCGNLEGEGSIRLARPCEGLQVEMVERPSVHGRLLDQEHLEPVADAAVQVTVRCIFCPSDVQIGAPTDEDGRFTAYIPLDHIRDWQAEGRRPPAARATVSTVSEGLEPAVFEFPEERISMAGDLGDILVELTSQTLYLKVVDELGAPVEGGLVRSDYRLAGPSDATGSLTLPGISRKATRIVVGAPGKQFGHHTIGESRGSVEDPLVITLAAGNLFVARVIDEDLRPLPGMRVDLSSQERLYPFEEASPDQRSAYSLVGDFCRLEGRWVASWKDDGATELKLITNDEGVVRVPLLASRVDFQLLVHDANGRLVAGDAIRGLGPEECREHIVVVP